MANSRGDLIRETLSDHRSRKLGPVYLFASFHQCKASERVVVLPTSQRADAADRCIYGSKSPAVTLSPNHSLMIPRHNFAPPQDDRTIRIKNQLSIVESPTATLIDSDNQNHSRVLRYCRTPGAYRTRTRSR